MARLVDLVPGVPGVVRPDLFAMRSLLAQQRRHELASAQPDWVGIRKEPPTRAELHLDTTSLTAEQATGRVVDRLRTSGFLPPT